MARAVEHAPQRDLHLDIGEQRGPDAVDPDLGRVPFHDRALVVSSTPTYRATRRRVGRVGPGP